MTAARHYQHIGPPEHRAQRSDLRVAVDSTDALTRWLTAQDPLDRTAPFTFVVDLQGRLRLAPRRSEHVACAHGDEVLAGRAFWACWRRPSRSGSANGSTAPISRTWRPGSTRPCGSTRRSSHGSAAGSRIPR